MRARLIAMMAVMAAPLIQATLHQALPRELGKRQGGDSFIPGTMPATCGPEDLCGGIYCLIRSRGDVCCKEGYACPGGSYCLTQGYCCPNGKSLADCAADNGVSLSAGFDTSALPSTTIASSTTASTTVAPVISSNTGSSATSSSTQSTPQVSSTTFSSTSSLPVIPPTTSSSTLSTPEASISGSVVVPGVTSSTYVPSYTVHSSAPTHAPIGSGTGAIIPTTSTFSFFTGAAARHADVGEGLAIILGLVGYLV